jgi:polysaccharide pyruvyl transferase WcaK-like protein
LRIGLITTLNSNIGDDFIREGICLVLNKVFAGQKIEFLSVNKHRPMTVYPAWHPCHWTEWLPRGKSYAYSFLGKLLHRAGHSRFDDCQLIVQCGAPVIWPGCHGCEWADPLWHQVVGRLFSRVPVLNLAAGSCYPWEKQPASITDPEDAKYLKAILGYCRLTTVRDTLAQKLCASLGALVPHIVCSAFLAANDFQAGDTEDGPILINYMQGAGHFDWDQNIDGGVWQNTVKTLIERLQKRHRLAFICHNQKEHELAGKMDASLPRLWPKSPAEYFSQVAAAKVALCNRIHAAVGLAGLGIPAIAVGSDTRLLMMAALGLPHYYVKDATADQLEEDLENLLASRHRERERLLSLQSETFDTYMSRVSAALAGLSK